MVTFTYVPIGWNTESRAREREKEHELIFQTSLNGFPQNITFQLINWIHLENRSNSRSLSRSLVAIQKFPLNTIQNNIYIHLQMALLPLQNQIISKLIRSLSAHLTFHNRFHRGSSKQFQCENEKAFGFSTFNLIWVRVWECFVWLCHRLHKHSKSLDDDDDADDNFFIDCSLNFQHMTE